MSLRENKYIISKHTKKQKSHFKVNCQKLADRNHTKIRNKTRHTRLGAVYMNITLVSGLLAFGVLNDPRLKLAQPRTISSQSSALRQNFILGSKIHVNTWFLSVPGWNEILVCLPTYDQWWMIILCTSVTVYGKDCHFVMNRFASITSYEEKLLTVYVACITEAEDSCTATELSHTITA